RHRPHHRRPARRPRRCERLHVARGSLVALARDDRDVDVPDREVGRGARLDTPVLAGRYELGPRLGLGGMAEVVRGHDRRLDRAVAVKLLRADRLDDRARERFRRESTSSAGFVHPHAVTTFDAGESNGWLYLVMELVEGPTLAERLHRD